MAVHSSHGEPSHVDFRQTTYEEPHPDSEEAVKHEKRRVAQELQPIHYAEPSISGLVHFDTSYASPSHASLHSQQSLQNTSREHLQSCSLFASSTDVQVQASPLEVNVSAIRDGDTQWYSPITQFWTTHISLTIDDGAHRDHLALERTFLAYLRTSLMFAIMGVLTAQLFRLQANPDPGLGLYVISVPLSATFIVVAIAVLLVGAARFLRLQHGLVRGKALAGGWEVLVVMGLSGLVLVALFTLTFVADDSKSSSLGGH